ncbi:aminotransferase class I/II-fold pyridoxal phosphate-dependent enzyme [Pseudomonas sp. B2M1-30]|uniref:pyridoxal phosphate-dependent aminotransferase n=1 Tax=Pseudomonas TaxID=286 RepID=UPI0021C94F49|nr:MULTISPECIES: histidinol-phosphate transaminase [Pseudomonas]MCU0120286.1 aminotransferase class I/II-fold pyridoxal phosphate-dependent enzyme [Pseudomonas sp. B2M1-30]MCU7260884.1 aminotransferase class I/II-fold pyridoxal phosphate-dependent enzyme [Pseudomonas koreensis]
MSSAGKDHLLEGAQPVAETGNVRLNANENPLGPSGLALHLCQSMPQLLSEYPEVTYKALRSAIGERWRVDPQRLVVGAGSDELIDIALRSLLKPGSRIVALHHSFKMYKIRSALLGADYSEIFPDAGDSYETALKIALEKQPDVVVLVNPSNPLGDYLSPAQLLSLVAAIPESTTVIIDEAYAEFAPDRENSPGVQIVNTRENALCLRTFSKAYGIAGLRLGWAYTSADLLPVLQARRAPYNVSSFSALAGEYVLKDSEHLEQTAEHCRVWGQRLVALFEAVGIRARSRYVNFVFVEFASQHHCQALHDYLQNQGFLTSPLTDYGLDTCLRISFGNEAQMTRLCSVLRTKLESQTWD